MKINCPMFFLIAISACQSNSNHELQAPSTVTHKDQNELSSLHEIVKNGDLDNLERRLSSNLNVNVFDGSGRTPLHLAAACGNLEIVKVLRAHGAINISSLAGLLPIHEAAKNGHLNVVLNLIEDKGCAFKLSSDGLSLIHYSCMSENEVLVEYLISKKIPFESNETSPIGAIHVAAKYGRIKIIKTLFKYGATANDRSVNNGATPIMYASITGQLETVKFLINNDADVNIADKVGRTALTMAAIWDKRDVVDFLVQSKADINQKDLWGNSPLHLSAEGSSYNALSELLAFGADVNNQNEDKETPLVLACSKGDIRAIKLLIESGANVNHISNGGTMPIHNAAVVGNPEIIELLIKNGANPRALNSKGLLPKDLAKLNKRLAAFIQLEKASESPDKK